MWPLLLVHFKGDHDIREIMAKRRHTHPLILGLMALILVFPPITGAVAASFGIDLSHHHCGSDVHDSMVSHHDGDHTEPSVLSKPVPHSDSDHLESHGATESDPYQCDQCHVALAALANDAPLPLIVPSLLPSPETASMLFEVRPPPAFKPPIA